MARIDTDGFNQWPIDDKSKLVSDLKKMQADHYVYVGGSILNLIDGKPENLVDVTPGDLDWDGPGVYFLNDPYIKRRNPRLTAAVRLSQIVSQEVAGAAYLQGLPLHHDSTRDTVLDKITVRCLPGGTLDRGEEAIGEPFSLREITDADTQRRITRESFPGPDESPSFAVLHKAYDLCVQAYMSGHPAYLRTPPPQIPGGVGL
jgi:hypothetical protein